MAAHRYQLVRAYRNYFIILPDCKEQGLVLDVKNGSTAPNTPLQLWTPNGTAAQFLDVSKLTVSYAKPSKPVRPAFIRTFPGNTTTTISWSNIAANSRLDKRAYEVIVDSVSYTTTDSYIVLQLSESTRSVKIRAVNALYPG